MTDESKKQAEDAIKEAYREYQWGTQGIDIWEEGAFRAGWTASLKVAEATKEMYPKAFVEWIGSESPYEYHTKDKIWTYGIVSLADSRMTTDELFEYWKQNIRK